MSEQKLDPQRDAFEQRSRALFEDSVERNRQRRMQKGGEAGKVAMKLPSLHNA